VFGRTDYNASRYVSSFHVSGREYLKKVGVDAELYHEIVPVYVTRDIKSPFETEFAYNIRALNDMEYILKLYQNFKEGKDLLDGLDLKFKETVDHIKEHYDKELPYDYLAISSYDSFICYELYTLYLIKRKNPKIKTVFGGNIVLNSDHIPDFLAKLDGIDYVLSGDFENCMEELLTGKLDEGKTIVKPLDLKLLDPPIYTAEDSIRGGGYITLTPSRDCPNKCSFCSTAGRPKFRYVPTDQFTEWVRLNNEAGVSHTMTFNSPTTNWSEKQFEQMLDGLIDIKNKLRLVAWFRIEQMNENLIQKMKKAGFIVAYTGIDVVSNGMRKKVNKGGTDIEVIVRNLELLSKYKLTTSVGFIRYFPGMSQKDNYMEYLFYKSLRTKFPNMRMYNNYYIMTSGSPMERDPRKYGINFEYWENPNPNFPELDDVISKIKKKYDHDWTDVVKYEEFDEYVVPDIEFKELRMGYIPDTELGNKYRRVVGE
jgi:hypothetical protein